MNNLSVKYFHRICFCKVRLPSVITNDLVMICSLKKRLILGRTNRIDYFVPFWRLIMKYKLLITGKHLCLFFLFGNTYFSFLLKDWKCCGLSSIFIWSKCFFNLYILIFVWLSKIWRFLEVQKKPTKKPNYLFKNWIWIHCIFTVVSKDIIEQNRSEKSCYI